MAGLGAYGWLKCALLAALSVALLSVAASAQTPVLRAVHVLGKEAAPEVEITLSAKVTPATQIVAGPDRIVLDFPGAMLDHALRPQSLHRGYLTGVRWGLYQASPPVTRVVLELSAPHGFEVFPAGNSVIVKLGGTEGQPASAAVTPEQAPAAPPPPRVVVTVSGSRLTIDAPRATLADVLREIQRRTGAEVAVPAGAEQEQVVVKLGPAPGKEVMAALFNGSRFDYIVLGSERDPGGISRILLSPVDGGANPFVSAAPVAVPPAQSVMSTAAVEPASGDTSELGRDRTAPEVNEAPPADQDEPQQ
jgi:hypothetical protein